MQLLLYPNHSVRLHAQLSAHDDDFFRMTVFVPVYRPQVRIIFIEEHMFVPAMVRICLFQLVAVRPYSGWPFM